MESMQEYSQEIKRQREYLISKYNRALREDDFEEMRTSFEEVYTFELGQYELWTAVLEKMQARAEESDDLKTKVNVMKLISQISVMLEKKSKDLTKLVMGSVKRVYEFY